MSLLSACGGSKTSSGQNVSGETGTSGKVIDGYISGARVFRDIDADFTLSSSEVAVITNSAGSYSGLTGVVRPQLWLMVTPAQLSI